MPTRLGWRVYVVTGKDFDLYAYTIIGARGEAEALEIARSVITPGNLKLRATVVTVEMAEDIDSPPPLRSQGQT